ncbi:MAG TPA: DNA polymerase III subunit alpha [Campylobacterales bacterium]|nr:DNA polymerase III subunit alpha [Campylobacterales bacterium]
MSKTNFTHLHLHTEYSLLDGANKIKDLAKKVKKLGMTSVAMTDHGNMFGAIDFYVTMKKEGIKPIIGMEAYIHNQDELGDKSTRQRFHLCLYAKNEIGYKNLMYLSSQSYINGFYYYPRINKKLLIERSEGLVCSSACLQGEVNWHLNLSERNVKNGAKGFDRAVEVALEYKEIFGDDFYLEIMRHGIGDQLSIDEKIIEVAQKSGVKIIATNDTHYLEQQYAESHEAFMCIAMNKEYDDPNRMRHSVHEFFVKSPDEMLALFADMPEAIENTQEIVDKCNLEIKLGNPTPPNFKFVKEFAIADGVPECDNDADYFVYKCKEGLEKRLEFVAKEKHEEYKERLEFEMNIINTMNFPGYMLIVWEFIAESKRRGVPVGPGRGSAAGSLVAFSLEITDIDPMKYDLLFERFLNPERVSMPDIDIDFCQKRRGEIIDYVVDKYGRNNVAQVITFGKLLAKGVIRDVARVMAMPYAEADKMAKLIPDELGINLEESYKKEPKIKELIESNAQAKRVWEFALALEGLNRNSGMHAAGLVMSNEELWHKAPLYKSTKDDSYVTQYSLKYLEDVDLIKFDFLGLKTLTVLDDAFKLIKARYDKDINFNKIDFDDPEIYKLIQTGATVGLFQIESSGMQSLNERLAPTNFEDLIAVLALYRPGPMESGMLDDFIDRKHGRQSIIYDFPELEPILKPTYGVIVYQEQVMQIVQTIGGFSLGGADVVRRAMGKKIKEEMDKLKGEFADGASKKGFDRKKSEELFDLIVKFAGYGFNKSHSAAYAMITFETSYLKTYYPQEFMSALLTSEADNTEKVVKYVDEVKRLGIKLLPPSATESLIAFSPKESEDEHAILFGLGAIKGVGSKAIESVIEARDEKDFVDLNDFIARIDTGKVNKRVLEALIKSGAMDSFGYSRRTLLDNIEKIVLAGADAARAQKMAENSLFGDSEEMMSVNIELENGDEYDAKTILQLEKETLGFYVSGHPLDDFREKINSTPHTLSSEIDTLADGSKTFFIGKVEEVVQKISKKGNKFGIVNLMDLHGNIEMMIFEKMMIQLQMMDLNQPVAFKVLVNKDDRGTNIRVQKIVELDDAKKEKVDIKKEMIPEKPLTPIFVKVELRDETTTLDELHHLVKKYPGRRPLKLIISSKLQDVVIESNIRVSDAIVEELGKVTSLKVAV